MGMTVTPRPQAHPPHDSASEGPFSVPEVAELLGEYAQTILPLIESGTLRAARSAGGTYRIDAADLFAFVEQYGEHDLRKVAARHPDTLREFRPEAAELVTDQIPGELLKVKPLRLPAGMEE